MRPVVFVDVDGPLNPFAATDDTRPAGYVEHRFRLSGWSRRRPLRLWLDPAHGAALLGLAERTGAELVWATTWEHKANTMVGPVLGLPRLPAVTFAEGPGWKFPGVSRYAHGRPLVWFDDDFDLYPGPRAEFLARRGDVATLLVPVDPHTGLTGEVVAGAQAWLGGLTG
ncbi:putative secreted protein [Actinokineospora spheciospongiae]|uniref:Putative secreted protein n=1 Tax=Actinokineospora spheciospongiae TaxID=909613 RepID=W7IFD8_9PSEU|nr:putative secreted protein [Actinokineospora spheciospongiae]